MQLEVSAEVILSQLGYSKSEASLNQAEKMMKSTTNFDKFAKHIFTLNDHLKKMKKERNKKKIKQIKKKNI